MNGVARWAERPGTALSDDERARGAARYEAARAQLSAYEAEMSEVVAGVPGPNKRRAKNLSRRVYALARRHGGEELVERVAEAVGRSGLALRSGVKIVSAGLYVLNRALGPGELARVTRGAQARKQQASEEGAMSKRKGTVKSAAGLDLKALLAEPTALERVRMRHAAEGLRMALAMHQPVVKLVVQRRLLDHASCEDLAREFGLTVEQVADLLKQLRPWVAKYTHYYRDDWYWVDGAAPQVDSLPATA